MADQKALSVMKSAGRTLAPAQDGDADLGPFAHLPGTWKSLPGRGWNMIALPFEKGTFKYRLLMNQYNETLKFSLVDKGVPNRGLALGVPADEADQFLVAIDYEQTIEQISAEDSPDSGLAGKPGLAIHHEPGLLLQMLNRTTDGLDIARLATIPHGDSVLALGRWRAHAGAPSIPTISGLPIGVSTDVDNNPYLAPYKHFIDQPFNGLFDPAAPNDLLEEANKGLTFSDTTELVFDTTLGTGGIVNIPFIVKQANAADMKSTFWISEVTDEKQPGVVKRRLQYSQIVMLDFFPRRDGMPGLIRWPHVSINTLEKVEY